MLRRWLKARSLSILIASISFALIGTSAAADAPPAQEAAELVTLEVEVEVIDYTADGEVISVHTATYDLDDTMLAPMFQVTAPHEDLRIDATTRSGAVQPQSTKSIGYLPAKTNTGCRSIALTAVGNTGVGDTVQNHE